MRKIEVRVETIGAMRNLRKSFADKLAFVDEIVQNAQRAKATELRIDCEYDPTYAKFARIVARDNGCGCPDLEVLFVQALSGWDRDVRADEDPFGMGFFSCMVVADKITVASRLRVAEFDVATMFAEGRTDVVAETATDVEVKGFKVVLEKTTSECPSAWEITSRIRKLAAFVPLDVYFNGELLAKKSFTDTADVKDPLARVVTTDRFTGVLYPAVWGNVETFQRGRPVSEVWVRGLAGRIDVAPGAANPRCPDRKEWISDRKFAALKDELGNVSKTMLLDVVRTGNDAKIDEFSPVVMEIVPKAEYRKLLRFDLDAKPGTSLADTIANATDEDVKNVKTLDELLAKVHYEPVNEPDALAEMPAPQEAPVLRRVAQAEARTLDMSVPIESIDYGTATVRDVLVPANDCTPEAPAPTGVNYRSLARTKQVFWCDKAEALRFVKQIREARYYGKRVLIAANKLQAAVVKEMPNIVHISELKKSMVTGIDRVNRGPLSGAEARAEKLMRLVARQLTGCAASVEIADIRFYTECYLNGVATGRREVADVVMACKGTQIMANRAGLPTNLLDGMALDAPTGPQDVAFLMHVMQNLAHELAHMLYGLPDGDVKFYEAQLEIEQTIVKWLFPIKKVA